MLIFLYGQDSFRSSRKLKGIIEQYQKVRPGGLNLIRLDFQDNNFEDFKESVETQPMFSLKKLIVLEHTFSNLDLGEKILNYLKTKERGLENNILVFFEAGETDLRHPLLSFLKKSAQVQEFKVQTNSSLTSWIKQEVTEMGGRITPAAVEKLVAQSGSDSWGLMNEMIKLVNFKGGQPIEGRDVDLLVGSKDRTEANIFKTIDAVAGGNKKVALSLLSRHLAQGGSPIYLLTMIVYQFRNLLIARDLLDKGKSLPDIIRVTGWKSFMAQKYYSLVQKFSRPRLKSIYAKILETDLKIKTGKINPRRGLELLVVEI